MDKSLLQSVFKKHSTYIAGKLSIFKKQKSPDDYKRIEYVSKNFTDAILTCVATYGAESFTPSVEFLSDMVFKLQLLPYLGLADLIVPNFAQLSYKIPQNQQAVSSLLMELLKFRNKFELFEKECEVKRLELNKVRVTIKAKTPTFDFFAASVEKENSSRAEKLDNSIQRSERRTKTVNSKIMTKGSSIKVSGKNLPKELSRESPEVKQLLLETLNFKNKFDMSPMVIEAENRKEPTAEFITFSKLFDGVQTKNKVYDSSIMSMKQSLAMIIDFVLYGSNLVPTTYFYDDVVGDTSGGKITSLKAMIPMNNIMFNTLLNKFRRTTSFSMDTRNTCAMNKLTMISDKTWKDEKKPVKEILMENCSKYFSSVVVQFRSIGFYETSQKFTTKELNCKVYEMKFHAFEKFIASNRNDILMGLHNTLLGKIDLGEAQLRPRLNKPSLAPRTTIFKFASRVHYKFFADTEGVNQGIITVGTIQFENAGATKTNFQLNPVWKCKTSNQAKTKVRLLMNSGTEPYFVDLSKRFTILVEKFLKSPVGLKYAKDKNRAYDKIKTKRGLSKGPLEKKNSNKNKAAKLSKKQQE